jgi:general secretion pathway protein N
MTRRGVSLLCLALAMCCAKAAFAQSPGAAPAESSNELAATAAAPVAAGLGRADLEPRPAGTAPSAARPRSNEANPLWAIPIETLRATRERPLFSASRRPPPPPVAAAEPVISAPPSPEPTPPEQPQMTLVGVVHGPSTDIGLFSNDSGKLVRLRIGEADHGWVVRSVDLRATILEKESRQVTLALPPRNAEILAAAAQPRPMAEIAFANPLPIPGQKFPRRGRHQAP